jgi:hypothetical protein
MGLHGSGRGPSHTYSVALRTTKLVESSFLHRLVHPYPSTSRRYLYLSAGAGSAAYHRGVIPGTGSCMDTSRSARITDTVRSTRTPTVRVRPAHSRETRFLVDETRPDDRVDWFDTTVVVFRAVWERILPVRMTHDETRALAAL